MGLTKSDFALLSNLTAIVGRELRVDTRAETEDGARYAVLSIDLGGGTLMDNGLYANPILSAVIPQTVSGLLTAGGAINQITDSGAFTMPLAASVEVGVILVVELPDTYSAQTPTLTRTGADLFEDNGGTDTVISWVGAEKLTLTSDGVSTWRL